MLYSSWVSWFRRGRNLKLKNCRMCVHKAFNHGFLCCWINWDFNCCDCLVLVGFLYFISLIMHFWLSFVHFCFPPFCCLSLAAKLLMHNLTFVVMVIYMFGAERRKITIMLLCFLLFILLQIYNNVFCHSSMIGNSSST